MLSRSSMDIPSVTMINTNRKYMNQYLNYWNHGMRTLSALFGVRDDTYLIITHGCCYNG